MQYFVQQLINGLTLGSIYGLIAIGYTMVYGIIGMINFAHGDIFMVGAFAALIMFLLLSGVFYSVPVVVALLVMMIVAHAAHQPLQLDDREGGLPAAARLVPTGAADHRDRHVDRAVEFRPGDARARATSRSRRWSARSTTSTASRVSLKQIIIVIVTARCWRCSGIWSTGPRSGARSAPASRTARWRRCSASMSTARSRSPSSWVPRWPPSPARCS